jgi:hypothetical protein
MPEDVPNFRELHPQAAVGDSACPKGFDDLSDRTSIFVTIFFVRVHSPFSPKSHSHPHLCPSIEDGFRQRLRHLPPRLWTPLACHPAYFLLARFSPNKTAHPSQQPLSSKDQTQLQTPPWARKSLPKSVFSEALVFALRLLAPPPEETQPLRAKPRGRSCESQVRHSSRRFPDHIPLGVQRAGGGNRARADRKTPSKSDGCSFERRFGASARRRGAFPRRGLSGDAANDWPHGSGRSRTRSFGENPWAVVSTAHRR